MIIKTSSNTVYEIYRENGKKHVNKVTDFYPYFYVLDSEKVPQDWRILKVENKEYTSLFGEKLKKVIVKKPKELKDVAKLFKKTFEADVLYKNRYIYDRVNHDKHNYEYRICFIDCEMDNREGFPYPSKAEYPVTLIVCYDNVLNKYVEFTWREDLDEKVDKVDGKSIYIFNDEKKMLLKFIDFISDTKPEIMTGWNFIEFDCQYLVNRMRNLYIDYNKLSPFNWVKLSKFMIKDSQGKLKEKVDIAIDGIEILDLMQIYQKFQYIKAFNPGKKLEGYSLQAVSEYEDIGGKYKFEGKINLATMWRDDIDQMIEYGTRDVELLIQLENKLKFIKFMDAIKTYAGCELKDTLTVSRILDAYVLRYAQKNGIVLPTALRISEEPYEGPFIYVKNTGLIKNVAGFDYKSFYPCIIETFNLSPEVKNLSGNYIEIDGLKINIDKEGFCPKIVKNLMQERYRYKAEMNKQKFNSSEYLALYDKMTSVKTIVNGFYGWLGYKNSRLYDRDIASKVTFIARYIASKTKEYVACQGYRVCYTHTDSVLVKLPDNLTIEEGKVLARKLKDDINKEVEFIVKDFGVEKNTVEIEFDKYFKSAVFTDAEAKYFALLVYSDGKDIEPTLRIAGFEGIKRDTPKYVRKFLQELYLKILESAWEDSGGISSVKKFISDNIEQYKKEDLINIAITLRISTDLKKESNAQHLKAANYSNEHLGTNFNRTDFIKMIFIKKVKSGCKLPYCDVVAFDDNSKEKIEESFEIDYERLVERAIFMKIRSPCEAINMKIEDLIQKNKGQNVLESFIEVLK